MLANNWLNIDMKQISTTISVETRIDKQLVGLLDEHLHAIATHFQHAKVSLIARKNRGERINKPSFSHTFGLSSRQFNAVESEVNKLFNSLHTNMARYIIEAREKYAQAKKRLDVINDRLAHQDFADQQLTGKQLL